MVRLYQLAIWLYWLIARIIAPFNPPARKLINGQRGLFPKLEASLTPRPAKLLWVHVASLGEYEQARPVMEQLKAEVADLKILLTFFSPSGYEARKNDPIADFVHYLPKDSPENALRFLEITRPNAALFIKYDLWYFYLTALHQQKIPVFLGAGVFRSNQFYFLPLGKFFQPALAGIRHFYLQNDASSELLKNIGLGQITVCGDPRFDRVLATACQSAAELDWVNSFKGEEPLMVLGSTWPSDIKQLEPFMIAFQSQLKFILVPHKPEVSELNNLRKLPSSRLLSEMQKADITTTRILIIDQMGLLSRLYRYADLAYVGGAFRGALHNTLEPAVYGIPVLFGEHPSNAKFLEAKGLVDCGGGYTFDGATQLRSLVKHLLENKKAYQEAANASRNFVKSRAGATSIIVAGIKPYLQ